jgi:hypothetical protein
VASLSSLPASGREVRMSLISRIAEWGLGGCDPKYDPTVWNANPYIRFNNNCYNYSTNIRTDTFAQPGRATGHPHPYPPDPPDCQGIDDGATSDGLKPVDCDRGCGCGECCHKVALVVSPGTIVTYIGEDGETGQSAFHDYHFYRRDDNGMWSHKPGASDATNLDHSGNPITDPRTADRGPYTVFCGCYCACEKKVTIN